MMGGRGMGYPSSPGGRAQTKRLDAVSLQDSFRGGQKGRPQIAMVIRSGSGGTRRFEFGHELDTEKIRVDAVSLGPLHAYLASV